MKTENLLLVGGALGVGYLWYSGKLASFGLPGPSTAAAVPAPPAMTLAQQAALLLAQQQAASSTGTTTGSTPAAPALGATVTGAAQVAAQAAAKDPYILPDAATFATFAQTPLPGYAAFSLTDYPNVLLRQDVWAAANTQVGTTSTPLALKDLQALMTSKGLSGYRDYVRHLVTRGGMRGFARAY